MHFVAPETFCLWRMKLCLKLKNSLTLKQVLVFKRHSFTKKSQVAKNTFLGLNKGSDLADPYAKLLGLDLSSPIKELSTSEIKKRRN